MLRSSDEASSVVSCTRCRPSTSDTPAPPRTTNSTGPVATAFSDLAAQTTELVLSALGLTGPSAAAHRGDRTSSHMRLNHYTVGDPVPEADRPTLNALGDVALGDHTDPGLVTLLIQDATGGLQALSGDHGWIDVDPRPGTIVVNLADCMQVLTNDRIGLRTTVYSRWVRPTG